MKGFILPREIKSMKIPIGVQQVFNDAKYEELMKRINSKLRINDFGMDISVNNIEFEPATNFLVMPTYEIYTSDGTEQELIGYRIRCVRHTQKGNLKVLNMNVLKEELKEQSWLKVKECKSFKLYTDKIDFSDMIGKMSMKTTLGKKVFTSSIGWVKGNDGYHFVPLTDYAGSITFLPSNTKKFKVETDNEMSEEEAFSGIYELLNVTTDSVTFPLLSITVLSALSSLIKLNNKNKPDFILNLYGESAQSKEGLSNLFCNLYNRSKHIYSIDSQLHSNQSLESEIVNKAKSLRDGVFIGKIEKAKEFKLYLNLLEKGTSSGLLLLSKNNLAHDSTVSIDTSGIELNKSIVTLHQSIPAIFSTWFSSFIGFVQSEMQNEKIGLGIKNNIDKFYRDCKKAIEEKEANYDVNKLRYVAWLLLGFQLFVEHGRKLGKLEGSSYIDLTSHSIEVFRSHCILESVSEDQSESNTNETDILMTDSLKFIHALDQLLLDEELYERNNPAKDGNIGWIDQEKHMLYLKNTDSVKKINAYLKSVNYTLKNKKSDIYQNLFQHGIIPEREQNGWGVQIFSGSKAVVYDLQAMRRWLQEHQYELAFLSEKS